MLRAVGKALSPSKRGREGGEELPAAKKQAARVMRCNACMLKLGVVRLMSEHASMVGKRCPAEGAPVKQLQNQALAAMGMASSREFGIPEFVLWWISQKRAGKAGQLGGCPVQQLSYSQAAYSADVAHHKLGGQLKKAVEDGTISLLP